MKWNTREIVLIAILSAVSAGLYVAAAQLWSVLNAAIGPFGGVLLGVFQIGHVLCGAIIRKPGVTFTCSVLTTVGQFFAGDPSGVYVLGWGVAHGIGAEVVFAITGYRKFSFAWLGLASGLGASLGHLYTFYLYGWEAKFYWLSILVLFSASFAQSGGLAFLTLRAYERRVGAGRRVQNP